MTKKRQQNKEPGSDRKTTDGGRAFQINGYIWQDRQKWRYKVR